MFLNYKKPVLLKEAPNYYICEDELLLVYIDKSKLIRSKYLSILDEALSSELSLYELLKSKEAYEKVRIYAFFDELHAEGILINGAHVEIKKTLPSYQYINSIKLIYNPDPFGLAELEVNCPIVFVTAINNKIFFSPLLLSENDRDLVLERIHSSDPIRSWFERKHQVSTKKFFSVDLKQNNTPDIVQSLIDNKLQYYYDCNFNQFYSLNKKTWPREIELANSIADSMNGGLRLLSNKQSLKNQLSFIGSELNVLNSLKDISRVNHLNYKTFKSVFTKKINNNIDPTSTSVNIVSLGKGRSTEQAMLSAIGEGYERYSAFYQGNEKAKFASYEQLGQQAFSPQHLNSLSSKQKSNYQIIDYPSKHSDAKYPNFDKNKKSVWYPGVSLLSKKTHYFPLNFIFADAPDGFNFCSWNSNGCAAGNSIEEACLQGLFEIIERDAIAIWWYNKLLLPRVPLEEVLDSSFIKSLDKDLREEWQYWLLDATHDLQIPVFTAIAKNSHTEEVVIGFGCHLSPQIAAERAFTELCQIIDVKDKNSAKFDFQNLQLEPYLIGNPHLSTQPHCLLQEPNNIKLALELCVNILYDKGLEVFIVDYCRPEVPLETIKIIVPGANHIWPQFSNKRLYQVPVSLGLREKEASEEELNKISLFL
ncbi:hypothetical protein C1E23_00720 [Pseudoalteromonas phenolica]|uniref:YcaO domain-containing protein n=1 Tax=Pseudoalteromonas phenolica TaxID=161398 RepID=A0A4Q7ISS2_9GAMM|nr:YcaO-like family protein [Pseudoalteromonas phenolica]RZQ55091.1 hypothetical protein C1E23_00720 [Pseudoalteromonas phenolica]